LRRQRCDPPASGLGW